jgi:hypothetical protein
METQWRLGVDFQEKVFLQSGPESKALTKLRCLEVWGHQWALNGAGRELKVGVCLSAEPNNSSLPFPVL